EPEMAEQEVAHEGFRVERREGAREALDDRHVDAQPGQARQAVVQRLEHEWRACGRQHRDRMRLEGERHRQTCRLPRPRHRAADDRLMAQVRAVEVAEREDGAGESLGPAHEVADDAHRHPIIYMTLPGGRRLGELRDGSAARANAAREWGRRRSAYEAPSVTRDREPAVW